MGKIKINLVSGAVVEKPLINAFKANNNSYVVFDNEVNGSMGLPIILVCKFENNKLTKILDQNEWGMVKEYLKNIIAGNQVEFIKVNNELSADDIYYTQLTLPVPSFDALKNAYKVEESSNVSEEVSIMDIPNSEMSAVNMSVNEGSQIVEPVVNPVQNEVSLEPVMPQMDAQTVNNNPVIDIPVNPQVTDSVISPANEQIVSAPSPVDIVPPVSPEVSIPSEPVIEPTVNNSTVNNNNINESIFKEQKEAFMQACENMFDALVQKFERELENRK